MAHMMKKDNFLDLVFKCGCPKLKTFRGSVYLYDRELQIAEVYCASNIKEAGVISAMNQSKKYRKWMNEHDA